MKRTIVEWEWWRILALQWPRRVWNMNDPHISGGTVEYIDHRKYPRYDQPLEVRWWKPDDIVSIVTVRQFRLQSEALDFYWKLRNRGYVEKV